jgi:hypothetical protein
MYTYALNLIIFVIFSALNQCKRFLIMVKIIQNKIIELTCSARRTVMSFLLFFISSIGFAQTLPVGLLDNVEDAYRRQQLLGNDKSNSSYMIRPLYITDRNDISLDPDDFNYSLKNFRKVIYENERLKARVAILPVVWQQQLNTHHPYGMNDGSMIPSRGYETQLSAGIFAKIGPLSIQLRPEFVYAQNRDFSDLTETPDGTNFYAGVYNRIDLPERFGTGAYTKVTWGQSSIRLTFDPVSLGLSNENLWWGPGVRSSLLMSNNASGFKHLTLNTTRAVETFIGSFEAQIIAGRLDPSGVADPVGSAFQAKPDDWRYLSGVAFTYQPKWVPNLFFGFDRSFIIYRKDMGRGFSDYFPFFSALDKVAFVDPDNPNEFTEDAKKRDQYVSAYVRWVMPESHVEFYFQFGRNDHPYDIRDLLVQPEHTRAYIAGLRKLIPLQKEDEFIQVGLEVTQMEGSKTGTIRAQPIWYAHRLVTGGYTQMGQVLGAGIGPGSNLQSLDVSWVKGLKKIGLQMERLVHNNDFAYGAPSVRGIRKNWVDLSFTGKFDWTFDHIVLSSQLAYIRSLNYQYQLVEGESFWNWDKQDVNNLQIKAGIMYKF